MGRLRKPKRGRLPQRHASPRRRGNVQPVFLKQGQERTEELRKRSVEEERRWRQRKEERSRWWTSYCVCGGGCVLLGAAGSARGDALHRDRRRDGIDTVYCSC